MAETTKRYTLDGETVENIETFVRDNDLPQHEAREVEALQPGDEMWFGGGAAPVAVLRREA
jgi:hypothetical protein